MDPSAGLDDVEKIFDPTGTRNSDHSVVQPIASRYTDFAIPAPLPWLCGPKCSDCLLLGSGTV
jgi:hypothetical protein